MIKLIVFDWDDVFTKGTTQGYFNCYHKTLESFGVKLTPEEERKRILANWGAPVEKELGGLLKENPQLLNGAIEKYEEILMGNTFVNCLSVIEGAQDLLKRLSQKYMLTIATGVHPRLLKEKIMLKFNIPQVFSQIESVYNVPDPDKGKPHPYMVNQILARQKIAKEQTVLVGDAKGDVFMAQRAGVEPIVVLTGHLNRKQAEDLGVKYIIKDVTTVEQVLDKLS